MDLTLEYVEMMIQAKEVRQKVPRNFDGTASGINNFFGYSKIIDKMVWLPRQDQLQNMVEGEFWQLHYDMYHFMQTIYMDNWNAAEIFLSMEQLWLAFVMDDKFDKKWNGEKWV